MVYVCIMLAFCYFSCLSLNKSKFMVFVSYAHKSIRILKLGTFKWMIWDECIGSSILCSIHQNHKWMPFYRFQRNNFTCTENRINQNNNTTASSIWWMSFICTFMVFTIFIAWCAMCYYRRILIHLMWKSINILFRLICTVLCDFELILHRNGLWLDIKMIIKKK